MEILVAQSLDLVFQSQQEVSKFINSSLSLQRKQPYLNWTAVVSVASNDAMASLECMIQSRIDSVPGLRESMCLYDDMRQFDIIASSMSPLEKSIHIPPLQLQYIQHKRDRVKVSIISSIKPLKRSY